MNLHAKDRQLLLQLPLFASLPEDEIDVLLHTGQLQEFGAQILLFSEGDPVGDFSIILDGQVDIVRSLGAPDERLLAVIGPGDFLGEMSVFNPQGRRMAAARTRTPTRSLLISGADFMTLLQRQPELAVRILVELTTRISNNDSINVRILQDKNRQLSQAYEELQQAQALLVEKEVLEHELNLARQIQETSLPKTLPPIPGWSLEAFWQPARKVGGDLYDVQLQPDGRLKFLIADVTGKGVPAALIMATTRSILRALMTQVDDPCQVLRAANDLLVAETPWNMFVTCFYGVLEPSSGRLRFANAGQNLPYRLAAAGPQTLRATGMPLGLFPGSDYIEGEAVIQPGESVLLYSDGLVEVHSPAHEMYGNPRLEAFLAALPPGAAFVHPLLETVFAYTGPNWEQEDDITLLTLTRHSL